jgi:hypothetical protein
LAQRAPIRNCGSHTLRRSFVIVLAALGTATLVASVSSAGQRKPLARALSFRTDHFLCYRVEPTSKLTPQGVLLRDQFGTRKAVAYSLISLCNPARKNATPVRNARAHLACYRLRSSQPFSPRRVAVTNQLDRNDPLAVSAPERLCLPSGKSLNPGLVPPLAKGLEHFQCYPVKPLKGVTPHSVKLRDEFGSFPARTLAPLELCNPVSKNRSRVVNARDHLVCYGLTPNVRFKRRRVAINNQFGKATLVASATETLCVPSLKRTL